MMFAGRDLPAALKLPIQQFDIVNQIHVHPSPIRERSAAGAPNLIRKKSPSPTLNSVIMGFDNPFPILIAKPKHASLVDSSSQQLVDINRFSSLQRTPTFESEFPQL